MSVLVLRCPTDASRWDTFHVDLNGNLHHKFYSSAIGSWTTENNIMGGNIANTAPDGAWVSDGSAVHVYCQGSGTAVNHWYWDGSNHTENL